MRKKWVGIMVVLLCLLLAWVTAAAETRGFGYVNKMHTNLRKTPGGRILFTCDQGDSLFITDQTTDAEGLVWYQVNTEVRDHSKTAWIQARYVDAGEAIFTQITGISAGTCGFLALRKDGQVVGVADENVGTRVFRSAIREWKNVEQIATGYMTYFGVTGDGTLVYCGNLENQALRSAKDVRLLACGDTMVVYLSKQGDLYPEWLLTQPMLGEPFSGEETKKLVVTENAVIALRNDGRVTLIPLSQNEEEYRDVSTWQNLRDVAVGSRTYLLEGLSGAREKPVLVGLREDGAIVTLPEQIIPNSENWTNLIGVAAGRDLVVGLRSDGTVVAAGNDPKLQAEVKTWNNIIAIDAGETYCAGLTKTGNVLFAGSYAY